MYQLIAFATWLLSFGSQICAGLSAQIPVTLVSLVQVIPVIVPCSVVEASTRPICANPTRTEFSIPVPATPPFVATLTEESVVK